MVKIKFGALVVSGSGSIGGHTIQNSKGGYQLRSKPINSKQPSQKQEMVRSTNKILQYAWQALTPGQQLLWRKYSNTFKIYGTSGTGSYLSGHSLFLKLNYQRASIGLPLESNPSQAILPALGDNLILDPNFEDPLYWNVVGGESVIVNNMLHLATAVGAYTFCSRANIYEIGKSYHFSYDVVDYFYGAVQMEYITAWSEIIPSGKIGSFYFNATATNTSFSVKRSNLFGFSKCSIFLTNFKVYEIL